ncbi:hypothetical protein CJF32_00001334 [Rutstroemia sp. NJR-2017a WRK4]|nr:hypothetical protein CJF32_00001334 [Rutstroemia sp. NJR-2017a WRK4]
MAAAVMQPLQAMSLDREIMAPSPISNNQSRHGRSKHGGSLSNNRKTRQRGYSIVDEREANITRALTKLLKRTTEESESEEQEDGAEKLVSDPEGWFNCEKVLNKLASLELSLPELKNLIASPTSKSRFTLKPTSEDTETSTSTPSEYLIRLNTPPTHPSSTPSNSTPTTELELLTPSTLSLPSLIAYETSYANYPLILSSSGIKRAGGQAYLTFASIAVLADGTESRISKSKDDADVAIYIDLPSAMSSHPEIKWYRNEHGTVVSEGDAQGVVPKTLWKKAVARRADIGVLYEDGEVRKEVPVGLRGKGGKGKRGGGRGNKGWNSKEMKERSEDEQESNEE